MKKLATIYTLHHIKITIYNCNIIYKINKIYRVHIIVETTLCFIFYKPIQLNIKN